MNKARKTANLMRRVLVAVLLIMASILAGCASTPGEPAGGTDTDLVTETETETSVGLQGVSRTVTETTTPVYPDPPAPDTLSVQDQAVNIRVDGTDNITITGDNAQVNVGLSSDRIRAPDPPPPAPYPDPEPRENPLESAESPELFINDTVIDLITGIIMDEGYSREPYTLNEVEHVCYGHRILAEERGDPIPTHDECMDMIANDVLVAGDDAITFAGDEAWGAMTGSRQAAVWNWRISSV